ncbi:MAG TPA: hypothetical protein VIV12_18265 [Streptosporangiaceae bacterium]
MPSDLPPPFAASPPGGVIAGPILRRADRDRVCVWICTLGPVRPALLVYRDGDNDVVGSGTAASIKLGERLYAHLLTATPRADRFPAGELLAYDIELDTDGTVLRLADLGLPGGAGRLGYAGFRLPSFFLQGQAGPLHVLHGSCRKLDAKGQDAFRCADELMAASATNLARRPSALFLTGDQIYGDDVSPGLSAYLNRLGSYLTGGQEQIPGLPPPGTPANGGRERWIRDRACFTTPHAANHLMTFGEYAAAYLMAFSDTTWPADTTEFAKADGQAAAAPGRWSRQRPADELAEARAALPAVRRVLANVPTYMIFDDHDVTDDWNLTRRWREQVYASPVGRRIVANALAAYWAFQGWGNDPGQFGQEFTDTLRAHLTRDGEAAAARFERLLWEFDRWSFSCPTRPVTVCLDTRTQRAYDSPECGARLIGSAGLDRIARLVQSSGHDAKQPLLLVSPTPICGLELHERRQKFLLDKVGPYQIDFEGWHANLQGLVDLMEFLTRRLRLTAAVVLSGDVHYGMTVDVRFAVGDATIHLAQLVSSGLKHSGTFTRRLLNLLGRLNRRRHERVGWAHPPTVQHAPSLGRRLMLRPVSTDEWAPGSPVFLAPSLASQLGISQRPDYRETRSYIRPAGPSPSALIGQNNIGSVTVDGHKITHTLLTRRQGTIAERAELDLSATAELDLAGTT